MRVPSFLLLVFLPLCATLSHSPDPLLLPSRNQSQFDRSLSTIPVSTSAVRSTVSTAAAGDTVLWEAAGEVLVQNWVADGWWLKRPLTLQCSDKEATGERCTVDARGSRMVLWIENTDTSGVTGPIELIGLKITGGGYSTSATTTTGGILILNSDVVMTDCEITSNSGSTTHPGGSAAGAIYIEASNVELNQVSFSDNLATSPAGFHSRDIFGNTGVVVMRGCNFEGGLESQPTNIFLAGARVTFKSSCEAGDVGVPISLELPTLNDGTLNIVGTVASYAQDSSSCEQCYPGSYSSPFAQHCTLCPTGKFNELPGGTSIAACLNCTAGYFSATSGTVTCEGCPAGTSSAIIAASTSFACSTCPTGKTSDTAASACSRCDNGFFKSAVGNGACDRCDLVVAGSTATRDVLPASEDTCICWFGEVLAIDRCLDCPPEGTECAETGLTLESMKLLPGFWRTSPSSIDVLKCSNEAACIGNENSTCFTGHRGPLCELCEDGFALTAGACLSCEDGGVSTAIGGVVVTLLILSLAAWCFSRRRVEQLKSLADGNGLSFTKTGLGYVQIIATLSSTLLVEFGPYFGGLTKILAAFNLDFVSFLPLGCVTNMDHHSRLLMYTLVVAVFDLFCIVVRQKMLSRKAGQMLLTAVFFINSLLLPQISMTIFDTFPCQKFDGDYGSFLVIDKTIDCTSAAHANRVSEIASWGLMLTMIGAMVTARNERADGKYSEKSGLTDALLVFVQVGGILLAMAIAVYERNVLVQERALEDQERLSDKAKVVPAEKIEMVRSGSKT
ncbi:hypothetical protein TrVE_jg1407 [Triparma verrucosa]|uniref:Tyrosine-protein kinase ephrin type A/B receptor-like domain-containing protein n=1 Tax=Triparma verrucosa TaxID=1606542 RepID=A0A9W7CF59_9STRA|nr:hypothetical protein TrVE_jg1407 [Triparma verrucosa]